ERGRIATVASYRRSAYQLPLNALAIGDPMAPIADVSRWNGAAIGPLIARVGPGSGGDVSFSQIDPNLDRPITEDVTITAEARPFRWLHLEAAGIAKRESPLLALMNIGVPASTYATFQVADPSFEPGSPQGGSQVTVYDRPPGSYGRDRYLLTNHTDRPAT